MHGVNASQLVLAWGHIALPNTVFSRRSALESLGQVLLSDASALSTGLARSAHLNDSIVE